MELTVVERIIIANQLRILEKLYPGDYKERLTFIERGYTYNYRELSSGLNSETPLDVCNEVIDILDMYRSITISYKNLPETDISPNDILFSGFDMTSEEYHYGYATFYLNELGRYEELLQGNPRRDLNSHGPTLRRYRRMLEWWKPFLEEEQLESINYTLNEEQIKELLSLWKA